MKDTIKSMVSKVSDNLVENRRYLHMHPELGFEETGTKKFITEKLTSYGVSILDGFSGNSVVGLLDSGKPGLTVAFRADIDALALDELNDTPYKSTYPGVMHACGHDAHTAMVLGLAEVLSMNKDFFSGKVKFIFQQAEEKLPGGAKPLCEEGVMKDVDFVFGLHVSGIMETGCICALPGPRSASVDGIFLNVIGRGGHGASPHLAIDPITCGLAIVNEFQQILSKFKSPMDPLVVNICKFSAGSGKAFNVIPESAEILGTVRSYNPKLREDVDARIKEIIAGVCATKGCTFELDYQRGYPALINHEKEALLVQDVVTELGYTLVDNPASMGGEDFSYYILEKPGAFFNLGTKNTAKGITAAGHNPSFDIDEDAMSIGVECFLGILNKISG